MGYESRVIIARKSSISSKWVEVIAELKLSKMEGSFLDLFDKEYKGEFYDFYAHNDTLVKEDCYGKPLTYATFNNVYKYCLDNACRQNYRRLNMLLALLGTIRTGWAGCEKEFIIIHYGY